MLIKKNAAYNERIITHYKRRLKENNFSSERFKNELIHDCAESYNWVHTLRIINGTMPRKELIKQ